MIGTRCLEDDACWLPQGYPGDQFGMAFPIIVESCHRLFRMSVNIKAVFRDVDTDGDLIRRLCYSAAHLFPVPCLSSGASNTQVSVRASWKRKGRSNSNSVLPDRRDPDPSPFTIDGLQPVDGEPFCLKIRGKS